MNALIAEDQTLYLSMLVERLTGDFDPVFGASTGGEAWEVFEREKPDFVLMDILLPPPDGLEIAERMLAARPQTRILTLTAEVDQVTLHRVFRSGVHGFVDKLNESIESLVDACRTVAAGKPWFNGMARSIRKELRDDPTAFHKVLSDREMELMPRLCAGFSNEDVGAEFGLKPSTVLWHRRNIMKKLEIHATTELMRYGVEKGFWKTLKG